MSLAAIKEPWATSMDEKNQGVHFNLGPGGKKSNDRESNEKYITKSEQIRINSAFDTCEHMAELLETSKWRGIQKTLHWLDRVLSSRGNALRSCRNFGKTKPKLGVANKNQSFYSPKMTSNDKSYFEMKKFPDGLITSCGQNLINSFKAFNNSKQSERLRNECEHKYKFGKNKLKHLYKKKSRRKTKSAKHYRKKILEKRRHHVSERPAKPNNPGIRDSEKFYHNEKKNKMGKFHNEKSGSENAGKIYSGLGEKLEHLERGMGARQGSADKGKAATDKWPTSLELRKSDGKAYKKENPWPNFVYHRVSSDLFHLGSTASNHKQSAYVAISVNPSGEPEAVRKKNKIFRLY